MSTTFEVYPRTRELPTFAELVDRSTKELHAFLDSVGVGARPRIEVRLMRRFDHAHQAFALRDPLRWDPETYAWFMVGDVVGGTDATFDDNAPQIAETWRGELEPKVRRLEPLISECVGVGHRWWFRRSAGQPAIVNLAYGLIAGSLAALTGGFVYSDDSAWDWERMPARPEEFLKFYFRPDQALEPDFQSWSRECIEHLAEELQE